MSEQQLGYVFNIDRQHDDRKFAILCEGPIDAILMDCMALLGSNVSGGQKSLINQLRKEIIVLPDKDDAGKKLVEVAQEMNWYISFPEWSTATDRPRSG
jgi:DNA primase